MTLTASNWQPGESVNIFVNDDVGQTWSRNVDVTADANGQIQDQFQLPDWFVATYKVTATGAQSGVATTSFTDGNVKFNGPGAGQNAPASWTVNYRVYPNNNCSGTTFTNRSKLIDPGTTGNATEGVNKDESVKLIFSGSVTESDSNLDFDYWTTGSASGTKVLNDTCVPGTTGGGTIQEFYAHFKSANSAPANSAPNVGNISGDASANEGQTKSYSVSATDPDSGDTLSYTWSITAGSSFAHIDGAANNSSVSLKFDDGPSSPNVNFQVVVDDGHNHAVTKNPSISVANVPPTVAFTAGPTSVNEGSTEHTYSYSISDPGADTVQSVSTSCGTGGSKVSGSDTNTNTSGSFKCTFADGPASPEVSARATDSDNEQGAQATQKVTVNNVDPTATLANNGPVDEGSSATVSFSNQTDPSSADTSAGFHYAYRCDGTAFPNAPTYAGTAGSSTSTSCSFDDNGSKTVRARIIDKDDGFTEYATTVTVNNVAPSATFNFPSAAIDEGPNGFNLSLTNASDPSQADTTAGFQYAFDCGSGYGAFSGSSSANCSADDGPATLDVGAKIKDKDEGVRTYTDSVTVNNVPPTIQSVTASAQNALTGKNVTFTGSATDPSNTDTTFGFYWKWAVDGGAFGNYGLVKANTYTTSFSSCGSHYVSAQAKDKDNGESVVFSTNSNPVQVYDGSFRPPVDAAPYVNTVQKGRVIPVKISVTCNGAITGLQPYIQLLSGDRTDGSETQADAIETYSVSAADTGQYMRAVDGGYIYNLRVPDVANQKYTIRVNPFGVSNASSNMYALLQTRK